MCLMKMFNGHRCNSISVFMQLATKRHVCWRITPPLRYAP
jgi:hypothetical protein